MAEAWPLIVEFDVPEPRIDVQRFVVAADGTSWDLPQCSDTIYLDPATNTAMLAPLCFRPNWSNTFTGDYVRAKKVDYTLASPSLWVENQPRGLGDVFLEGLSVGAVATLTESLSPNQPMFLSAYIEGVSTTDGYFVLECGWNRGAANELTLRLMTNGDIEVVKGSAVVGRYNRKEPHYKNNHAASTNKSLPGKFVSFALIPCRRRELLIVTDWGQSFSHAFDDLDADVDTNEVTPPGQFYWYVPVGKPSVQLAKLKFETSGDVIGSPVTFRTPPPTGTTFSGRDAKDRVGLHTASIGAAFSLVREDLSAYTPDGVIDTARIKVALTGDGTGSYGIYASDAYSDPTTTTTVDDAVDVTTALESLSLSVDEAGRCSVRMTARKKNLEDAGVNRPHILAGRPFRVALGTAPDEIDVVRGTLKAPSIEYLKGDATTGHDWALLSFEGQDRSAIMEQVELRTTPYDGVALSTALLDLLTLSGFGGETYAIADTGYTLPYSPAVSTGEWSLMPERGDSPGQWIDKLRQEYAATFITGWVPTATGYAWWFVDPQEASADPIVTLYPFTSDAVSEGGASASFAHARIYKDLDEHYETPEANQIVIVGQDPKTRLLISATYNDEASQDAGLAVADRPENWLGWVQTVTHSDPSLTTQAAVGRAGLTLHQRLTPGRHLVEWESEVLVDDATNRPLWLLDTVRLMEPDGTTTKGDYRIIAIPQMVFELEASGRAVVRKARYRGWLITPQTLNLDDSNNSVWI